MSNYRRHYRGRLFFFTVVTYKRRQFLTTDLGRKCLKTAIEKTKENHPFHLKCMCLLPEHFHCIMELPGEDNDYSLRLSLIKKYFTREYVAQGGAESRITESMKTHRNRGVWQKRFWEHAIRDQEDYANHVNYIHYNPLKHSLVKNVQDWPWSTYHKYQKQGWQADASMIDLYDEDEHGE